MKPRIKKNFDRGVTDADVDKKAGLGEPTSVEDLNRRCWSHIVRRNKTNWSPASRNAYRRGYQKSYGVNMLGEDRSDD